MEMNSTTIETAPAIKAVPKALPKAPVEKMQINTVSVPSFVEKAQDKVFNTFQTIGTQTRDMYNHTSSFDLAGAILIVAAVVAIAFGRLFI